MSNEHELNAQDRDFADRVAAALDQPLDTATLARLQAAREEAVLAASQPASRARWLVGGSAGGAIAAGFMMFFLLQEPAVQPFPAMDEAEFAAASEMELLESLELLVWLDDEMLAAEARDEG